MRKIICLFFLIFSISFLSAQTITGNLSFCQGGSTVLSLTGTTGSPTFQWQKSTDNGINWVDITPGGNSINYTVTTAASYRVIISGTPTTSVDIVEFPNPEPDFIFSNNICSGNAVQFTSTISGGTAPYSYSWNFGDATFSTSANPAHIYTSLGCGTANFTATLTTTDVNGCAKSISKTVSIKQTPNVQVRDVDVFNPFSNCHNNPTVANPNYTLTLQNNSPSAGCIASYNIDWGDGTIISNASFPISHTYTQIGAFSLIVTANGINGCNNSKSYVVANQSNPAGSLGTLGSTTNLCVPSTVPFTITNWQLNSTGTIYVLNFGDGSSVTLSHPLNLNYTTDTVLHTYVTSSCPTPTYTATLQVINACATTPYSAGNIQIRIKPIAAFTSPTSACINQNVCFINTTVSGNYGPTCVTTSTYSWNFGDGSPLSNSTSPCHTYSAIGTYTVTLSASNPCGTTTFNRQICVVGPASSSFTIDNNIGCSPLQVNATNTSNTLTNCVAATYAWFVTYASSNCGAISQWSFTNNTNASSIHPSFIFTGPGTYTIILTVTNACGPVTSSKVVTVKKPPTISINAIPSLCSPATITPSATVTNCGSSTLNYLWSFPGGTPTGSTQTNPGSITYNIPGTYTIALNVGNECGSITATQTFIVKNSPATPTAGSNSPLCSGNTLNLTSSTITSGVTYSWIGPSGFTSTLQNPIRTNATTAMSGTYTVTVTSNGCSSPPASTIVTINQTPASPTVSSPINFCQNDVAVPLTAISSAGNTLNWYTVLTGGTPTTIAPTPSTIIVGTTTYYVSQISTAPGCESSRLPIVVNIKPVPFIGGSSTNPTSCILSNGTISLTGLVPNTTYTVQYLKNGTPIVTSLTSNSSGVITINSLSIGNYSNITLILNGCTSNTIGPFILINPAAPATPTAGSNSPLCSGNTLNLTSSTTSTGVSYSWTGPGGYTSVAQNPTRTNVTTTMSGIYTVTVILNGCSSIPSSTIVTIDQTPSALTVTSPISYCQNATAVPLTATPASGNILNWYTVAVGGTPTTTAPVPVTTTVGSTSYYVSQVTPATGCESSRTPMVVNIKLVPVISGNSTDPTSCTSSNGIITITGLTPNTSYTVQYTKNSVPVIVTMVSNTIGTITVNNLSSGLYADITVILNGCISNIIGPFTLVNPSAPGTPVAGSNSPICSGSSLNLTSSSTSTGVTYSWTGPSGYSSTLQNPFRTNATTAMSGTYVVTVTLNGCVSTPASTIVIVNQTPAALTVTSPISYCQNDVAIPLTATATAGNTLNWYTVATGGTSTTTAPIPQTSLPGTTIFYVSQISTVTGCESTRTAIVVNIKPVPVISGTSTDPTSCSSSNGIITITGLISSTAYTVQYNKNGVPVTVTLTSNSTGGITINNLSAGTYSDVTVALNGCISNLIGPFTIVNPAAPNTPTAGSNSPLCSGNSLNLTASTSSTGTITYLWTGPGGFTSSLQNPVRSNVTAVMSGNYFVTVTLNGCTSTAASTNVIVNQTPLVPTAITPISYCQDAVAIPLNATPASGNTLNWYTGASGGTPSTTAPTPQTIVPGSTTFYVSQISSSTGCESPRIPIIVIINPVTAIIGTSTDPTTCSSSNGIITITGLISTTPYSVQYFKNGTPVTTTLTSNGNGIIIINNLSSGVYTNISVISNGCVSNIIGPFILVNPSGPTTPTAGSNSPLCSDATLNLTSITTSTGVTFSWTGPGGYTSALQNPVRTNTTIGMSGTYTVTVTLNGCTSAPAAIAVVINQTPPIPSLTSPINYCQNATAVALIATSTTGNSLNWYTVPSGGTPTITAPIPQTISVGTTNYYVSQINANTGCESPRASIVVNVKPVPFISGSSTDPTTCLSANGSIAITGLTPGTSYNVQYYKNGTPNTVILNSDIIGSISLNNLSPGNYSSIAVTLNGCISNFIGPFILVNPPTPTAAIASSNSPLCSGNTLNLFANSPTTGVTYTWIGPAGFSTILQNPTIANVTTSMSGTYTVTAAINGCNSTPVSVNILINSSLTVTASSNAPICSGTTLNLLSNPSTTNNVTYNWLGPNGFASSLQNPIINNVSQTAAGVYNVTATLFPGGCSSTSTTIIIINQSPAITGSFTDPVNCSPPNGLITISGLTPGVGYGIQYIRNGGNPVTNNLIANNLGIITLTNLSGGIYTNISASLSGCKSNLVGPFTLIETFPSPPSPSITSNSPLCIGSTLNLASNSTTPGATYSWSGPNNFISALQNPFINNVSLLAAGNYFATVNYNGCTSTATSVNVVIGDYPTVNLGPDLILAPNAQPTLTSQLTNGPFTNYLWMPSTNLSCPNCQTTVATILKDITYVLTVKNTFGCSASDTINIKVLCEKNQVFIPAAFTPDGDGINDILLIRSAGTVTVKYFRIFNKWGQLIFERLNFPSNNTQYGWNGQVNGKIGGPDVFVYTADILCTNGTSFFYKGNVSILK